MARDTNASEEEITRTITHALQNSLLSFVVLNDHVVDVVNVGPMLIFI